MASTDTAKATAQTTVRLTGNARAALLAINAKHGVPIRRLVDMAVKAGLASVCAQYGAPSNESAT